MPEYPSPVRDRAETKVNGAGTSVTINYPTDVEAGDRIILLAGSDTGQTYSLPAGWTILSQTTAQNESMVWAWHVADGTEGGTTFTLTQTTSPRDTIAHVWSIDSDGTPTVSTWADGNSTTPAPPSFSPAGGSAQYLWITGFGIDVNREMQAWEDGLGGWLSSRDLSSFSLSSAFEVATRATYAPTNFEIDGGSEGWVAGTLALPVEVTATDGFPTIPSAPAETNTTVVATDPDVNLPSGIQSGDEIIIVLSNGDTQTSSITGYIELVAAENGTTHRTKIFRRTADGTEGATVTATITGSGSRITATAYLFRNIDGTKTEAAISDILDTGAPYEAAFPSLTPAAGSDNIAWLIGAAIEEITPPLTWPVDFADAPTHLIPTQNLANYSGVFSAVKFEAATTVTPDDITYRTAWRVNTFVVAVYGVPASSGGGGGNRIGGVGAIRRRPPRSRRRGRGGNPPGGGRGRPDTPPGQGGGGRGRPNPPTPPPPPPPPPTPDPPPPPPPPPPPEPPGPIPEPQVIEPDDWPPSTLPGDDQGLPS